MSKVTFVLNGQAVESSENPTKRLLDILREDHGLVGAKEGCGEGECGGCAVLLDYKIVNSCLTPLGSVQDKQVITIEGLSLSTEGQTIKKAFEDYGSVQCGICTPGMMIATASLLHHNQKPTEAEIREGLSGNLCRCTGYNMIVKAIQYLADEKGELWC
ncbi:MAG: 2Fe-2S iron-sulfur cluster-binding protein [Vallitaleaceae bacterium]|nr:2Fe-2S iron-sulfur cluster-binding protein [Vallitaleaceae bacterium]